MSCSSSKWKHYQLHEMPYEQTSKPSLPKSNPIKRRSRASKRTPTTILNTDIANFRPLVQQLTGRPSAPTRVWSRKGRLNIKFGKVDGDEDDEYQVDSVITSTMLPFGYNSNNYQVKTQEYHQQGFVEHEDSMSSTTSFDVVAPDPITGMEVFDDFDVDNVCFEELAWLASSNGINGDP